MKLIITSSFRFSRRVARFPKTRMKHMYSSIGPSSIGNETIVWTSWCYWFRCINWPVISCFPACLVDIQRKIKIRIRTVIFVWISRLFVIFRALINVTNRIFPNIDFNQKKKFSLSVIHLNTIGWYIEKFKYIENLL